MNRPGPSDFGAVENNCMAMSYEEGLLEIDCFYSSPSELPSAGAAVEGVQAVVGETQIQHRENSLAHAPEIEGAQETGQHDEQTTSMSPEAPVAEQDEFSTLMEDIDQFDKVIADDVAPSNPKGQLRYILNDEIEDSLEPTRQVADDTGRISPAVTQSRSTSADLASVDQEDQNLSSALPQDQVKLNEEPREKRSDSPILGQASTEPAAPPQPAHVPVAFPKLHAQKGLTLLSPRRGRSLDSLRQPTQPRQPESHYSPRHLASLNENRGLNFLTPRHGGSLQPSPMPDVNLSSDMPSSRGKSSLMDEMREEEERNRSKAHSRTPPPVLKSQPDVVPVANGIKERNVDKVEPVEDEEDTDLAITSRLLSSQRSLEDYDKAQHEIDTMTTKFLEAEGVENNDETDVEDADPPHSSEELSSTTTKEDQSAEVSHEVQESGELGVEEEANHPAKEISLAPPISKSRYRPGVKSDQQVPQRRSTRLQPYREEHPESEAMMDDADHSKLINRPLVPSKRERSSSSSAKVEGDGKPAPKSLRLSREVQETEVLDTSTSSTRKRKTGDARRLGKREMSEMFRGRIAPHVSSGPRKTRTQKEEEAKKSDERQQPEMNTGSTTTKNATGGHIVSNKEMQSMLWGSIGPHVSPGPRKTRAQKEEEAKKAPNAGRAAKERHEKKGV